MTESSGPYLLNRLAYWNVVLHVVALVLTWFFIRPGTPAFEFHDRQAYLVNHVWQWSIAWGVWMVCALVQVAFYADLARYLTKCRDAANLALMLACSGVGIDLLCDTTWIALVPRIPMWRADTAVLFQSIERIATAGGLVVANGLYSLAAFILTLCLRHQGTSSTVTILLGYGVFAFGMLLSLAGLLGSQHLAELATGPTILCFCGWVLLVTRDVTHEKVSG